MFFSKKNDKYQIQFNAISNTFNISLLLTKYKDALKDPSLENFTRNSFGEYTKPIPLVFKLHESYKLDTKFGHMGVLHAHDKNFIKEIEEEIQLIVKPYIEAEKKGSFTFETLAYALGRLAHNRTIYIIHNFCGTEVLCNGRWVQEKTSMSGVRYYSMNLRHTYVTDGNLNYGNMGINIPEFEGEKTFEELGIKFADQEKITRYQKRGMEILQLANSFKYAQFKGKMYLKTMWGITFFNTNARVMVDDIIANQENILDDIHNYDDNILNLNSSFEEIKPEHAILMSPILPAFDLKNKRWGYIDGTLPTEINFREDAIENLIIDAVDKRLLTSIVESDSVKAQDFISDKGGGSIFLLHGTPGVGKTLTAEAISEAQKKPLYMVSVGELGTEVSSLEAAMKRILTVAQRWNAVLLIDEADIFLEARDTNNIQRNAMVGVFLRTLEYYDGILFLTTNRANNLDQAFYSRISLALHYKPLDVSTKEMIWKKQFDLYEIKGIDIPAITKHCETLDLSINGRQIKNTTRLAMIVATKEGRTPTNDDINMILRKIRDFEISTKE